MKNYKVITILFNALMFDLCENNYEAYDKISKKLEFFWSEGEELEINEKIDLREINDILDEYYRDIKEEYVNAIYLSYLELINE